MAVVHTYFYIVVDTQRGCHTLKLTIVWFVLTIVWFVLFTAFTQDMLHKIMNSYYGRLRYSCVMVGGEMSTSKYLYSHIVLSIYFRVHNLMMAT